MLTLCLLLPLAQQTIAPKTVSWQDLRTAFPVSWEFPQVDALGEALPSAIFETQLQRLAQMPLLGSEENRDAFYLGDLITICSAFSWKSEYVQTVLDVLATKLSTADSQVLHSLLQSEGLWSKRWRPSKHKDDGMVFGPTWKLPRHMWLKHKGSRAVEQAASLILADLATIKKAEHAFPNYFNYVENEYLKVSPNQGSYLRVVDAEEGTCAAACLSVKFKADLPFPFSNYAMDLNILHRVRPAEDLITFIFGIGPDIHWMAGYDRYWTIRNREGDPVATLLVRQLAFDLSGIPEGSSHRREGLRSGIGNLRLAAEGLFDQNWIISESAKNSVPPFPVLCPE
ncbi:MAG: hypothetical protein QM477_02400 [Planctomycetota bacterium]